MKMKVEVLVLYLAVACVSCLPTPDEKGRVDTSSNKIARFCHSQTPCGWRVYNYADYTEIYLTNSYCVCSPEQKCVFYENRSTDGYIELRCKKPRS